jgi:glucose-1-phosphate adenylyltransferase
VLAGGQGTRLSALTKKLAKPAVPFGGKYRIIDFTLSNCSNSGIHTVGVLTQYQPLILNSYIGIGSAWDLDRKNGGVTVLPPYSESSTMKWYSGTASAVYQNLNYVKQFNPEYVLILSGDHIYKMDYCKMLEYHIEKRAEATISVIKVRWDEASRFGIMNTDENMKITEFVEKPKIPKSNLASMGIYIFNWDLLQTCLEKDNLNPLSSHDFGKDIIPALLNDGRRLVAYPFSGYWKDVGTVQSLWEANMDLLEEECGLNIFDSSWRIYSVNPNQPPQSIGEHAVIRDSLVNEGCVVDGYIHHSVLFQGVVVDEESYIKDSVILPNTKIEKHCTVERAIITCDLPEHTDIRGNESTEIALVTPDNLHQWIA